MRATDAVESYGRRHPSSKKMPFGNDHKQKGIKRTLNDPGCRESRCYFSSFFVLQCLYLFSFLACRITVCEDFGFFRRSHMKQLDSMAELTRLLSNVSGALTKAGFSFRPCNIVHTSPNSKVLYPNREIALYSVITCTAGRAADR